MLDNRYKARICCYLIRWTSKKLSREPAHWADNKRYGFVMSCIASLSWHKWTSFTIREESWGPMLKWKVLRTKCISCLKSPLQCDRITGNSSVRSWSKMSRISLSYHMRSIAWLTLVAEWYRSYTPCQPRPWQGMLLANQVQRAFSRT